MVEVIVVLIIIAIAAAIVVPRLGTTKDQEGLSATRTLANDLRYAQSMALTYRNPVTVTFTPDSEDGSANQNTYLLSYASGPLNHPITKTSYRVQFTENNNTSRVKLHSAIFGGESAVDVDDDDEKVTVTFDETGSPDNSGTIELRVGDFRFQVEVAAFTGKLTVTRP